MTEAQRTVAAYIDAYEAAVAEGMSPAWWLSRQLEILPEPTATRDGGLLRLGAGLGAGAVIAVPPRTFKQEMEQHMFKEDHVLFPMCRQLDSARARPAFHCGTIGNPIRVMIREHDDAAPPQVIVRWIGMAE